MPLVSPGYLLPDDAREEFGYQTSLALPDPAVGSVVTRRTPGAFYEIVVSAVVVLATSGAAGNRNVVLSVSDGDGASIAQAWAPTPQGPGLNFTYSWSIGLGSPYAPTASVQQIPLFSVVVISGWTVIINAAGLQAGDQFSRPAFVLQQFNTGLSPEEFHTSSPVEIQGLGTVSLPATVAAAPPPTVAATPTVAPTVTAAPAPAPAAPKPAPALAPAPAPTMAELAAASSQGGPVIRE